MRNNQKFQKQKRAIFHESGVGLIEVLIAMLIFGTALVTLSGLQTRSLQFNQSAYLRSQASMLAYDIIDRIRINRVNADSYDFEYDDETPTGASLRDEDLKSWTAAVSASLPDGKGEVICSVSNVCEVKIKWTELAESAQKDADGNDAKNATVIFTYSSQI
jgi:type IV pilus assembly protein PilV